MNGPLHTDTYTYTAAVVTYHRTSTYLILYSNGIFNALTNFKAKKKKQNKKICRKGNNPCKRLMLLNNLAKYKLVC